MALMKKVLLLTNGREAHWLKDKKSPVSIELHDFIAKLNDDPTVEYSVSTADLLRFSVVENNVHIYDTYTERDLSEYDIIHFRNSALYLDYALAISAYMEHKGKQAFEHIDVSLPAYGKLSQMVLYAIKGIKVPNTWSTLNTRDLLAFVDGENLIYPLIVKDNEGIKGHNNHLVHDRTEFTSILRSTPGVQFVVQEMIPNDGDYRVLFFGEGEPLIFKRIAAEGSHLNNTSRGGRSLEISPRDFNGDALELAQRAAWVSARALAGVDVIQNSQTKEWLILEVNANPALSSGSLIDKKIIGYKKMIGELL